MKTDFSINVNVSLGVTPEVIALVGTILSKKPVPVVAEQQPSKDDHQEDAPQAPQKKPNGRSSKTAKAEQEQQPSGEEAAPGQSSVLSRTWLTLLLLSCLRISIISLVRRAARILPRR